MKRSLKDDCAPDGISIALMPETESPFICAQFSHLVDPAEHERCLSEPVREAIEEFGYYHLLCYFTPDFLGWAPAAADVNMKAILEFGTKCRKVAYVNPPEKKMLQMKLAGDVLIAGEIRYFNADQLQDALKWIRQK